MKTDLIRQVRENSGWFIALGVVMLILGIAAIVEPFMATVAIARVFSWIFLFAGIICICLRRSLDLLQISLPLLLKPRKMRKHQDITIYQRPDDELYNSSNAFI